MSLLQRVVSVLLYGHGTSQQVKYNCSIYSFYIVVKVYRYLQPLMMCMSPSSTVEIITKLSNQFDAEVMNWASELKKVCLFMCLLL